jgi:hypothetical protein
MADPILATCSMAIKTSRPRLIAKGSSATVMKRVDRAEDARCHVAVVDDPVMNGRCYQKSDHEHHDNQSRRIQHLARCVVVETVLKCASQLKARQNFRA